LIGPISFATTRDYSAARVSGRLNGLREYSYAEMVDGK